MSVQAISWVLDHSEAKLGARLVLLGIANHADKFGEHSWASVKTLSEMARLSERQTRTSLRVLEELGEIEETGTHPRFATHVYRLPKMVVGGGAESAPGGRIEQEGGQNPTASLSETAPEPSLEPSLEPEPRTSRRSLADAFEKCPRPGRELVELLVELIVENGSKRPAATAAWYDAARLLLSADRRPRDEAERLLRWSQADEFWRGNVLSLPTFRRQYDRLRLQERRGTTGSRRGGIADEDAIVRRIEDRRRRSAS